MNRRALERHLRSQKCILITPAAATTSGSILQRLPWRPFRGIHRSSEARSAESADCWASLCLPVSESTGLAFLRHLIPLHRALNVRRQCNHCR